MIRFLLILFLLILLFSFLRRFIFFSAYYGFNKAAKDLAKKQEQAERKRKAAGSITVEQMQQNSLKSKDDGEYVDYEEIK